MSETATMPKRRERPPGTPSAIRGERFKISIAPVEPLAVGAEEAAKLCGIGMPTTCSAAKVVFVTCSLNFSAGTLHCGHFFGG